jgi:uncharacterized OB-fold protein
LSSRPLPRITAISRPFWEGCNNGRLVIQRCRSESCGRWIFYPRVACPHCAGGDLEWRETSGKGTIASYTKVHRPQHDSFRAEVPIWFVAVRLQEGPILYSRLEQAPTSESGLIGRPVEAVFSSIFDGQRLPYMRLAG